MTKWNETIPDAPRPRLASIELASYSSGPLLGHVQAGPVAAGFGVSASVVQAACCAVPAASARAAFLPRFVGYDSKTVVRRDDRLPQEA